MQDLETGTPNPQQMSKYRPQVPLAARLRENDRRARGTDRGDASNECSVGPKHGQIEALREALHQADELHLRTPEDDRVGVDGDPHPPLIFAHPIATRASGRRVG